ncbi:VOC family protein [Campylobacter sp. Marseille-Q3452]|uniref:VOC family protein n=1 Tax=Campylobacter massiliensis TaxID=2762557 RepID=A0A842JEH2_9BACT|nr:VOC family protein [Campylobacter massiliensis]MBC2883763.1 VOC family protein [Campylobacter massiliensis]
MRITSIDHIVLTVADLQRTLDFYVRVLGMREIDFANGRKALAFGSQKINLHVKGEEIFPNALNANVGTADICLLTDTPLESVLEELEAAGIAVEQGGVVPRTGALGAISSIYVRDPDGNLIEISRYD